MFGKPARDTDEESGGIEEIGVRKVDSDDSGAGFETSFLIVNPSRSSDYASDEVSWTGGAWVCRPYKRERLMEEIKNANRRKNGHGAILNALKNSGVMIFIVDAKVSITNSDIIDSVQNVIKHITTETRMRPGSSSTMPRCLLYRDQEGRFFNLTLTYQSGDREGVWKGNINTFSSVQAISMVAILSRSFACANSTDTISQQFQPAYLSLILGLVFREEIGMAWTNVGMFVRGMPSISAYELMSGAESDWVAKIILLILALAGIASGDSQWILTLTGISLACIALLANLGSRAWFFMNWKPVGFGGVLEAPVAFVASVVAGIAVPYLGHQRVASGDKVAMESIIRIAFVVAVAFVLSDYDDIQRFLVIGSEYCNQDYVNLGVGVWWTISLILSLVLASRIEAHNDWPDHEEPLLEDDHTSPVGFLVPNLPAFPIDPKLAKGGVGCLGRTTVLWIGIIFALVVGAGISYTAFSDMDEDLAEDINGGSF